MIKYDKDMKYDDYKQTQIDTNLRKVSSMTPEHSWARPFELVFIAALIKQHTKHPFAGICHGVRTGNEVRLFREYLDSEVIGTDISNTRFADVVLWDFNELNPDWVGKFDFVYSNAFDHSFDPGLTIKIWQWQLRKCGKLFIHWGYENYTVNKPNCVGGTKKDVINLFVDNGITLIDCVPTHYDNRYVFIAE